MTGYISMARRSGGSALPLGAAALAVMIGALSPAWAGPAPDSFAALAKEVTPAVVNISIERRPGEAARVGPMVPRDHPYREFFERFFGPDGPRGAPRENVRAVGSGFIIDPEGFVVTNNHVIEDASAITVTLSEGRAFEAELVGRDRKTDLALLKIEAEAPLPAVDFGESDGIEVGDWVLAVGNPFGLGGTVTAGIVSARGRDLRGGALTEFLQIDAPINQGNSGGPTFDMTGRVIGVNTAIYSPNGGSVGIGFAIPANAAKQVIADLKRNGKVERGWLGVRIQPVTPEIAEGFDLEVPRGALVASVEAESPAAAAAIQPGDVILAWDGRQVRKLKDLSRFVAATPAGREVEVAVWRKGRETSVSVVTGVLPEELSLSGRPETERKSARGLVEPADTGLGLADLTAERRERLGLDDAVTGALVVEVAPDSTADRQGLAAGDVIRSVARRPVASAAEAAEAFAEAREQGRAVVPLRASRRGVESFYALRLKQA